MVVDGFVDDFGFFVGALPAFLLPEQRMLQSDSKIILNFKKAINGENRATK